MSYKFKFKRRLFWRSFTVIGHGFVPEQNKMVLYFPDGSIREISNWTQCETNLGSDWVLANKKHLEEQVGQSIPLKV